MLPQHLTRTLTETQWPRATGRRYTRYPHLPAACAPGRSCCNQSRSVCRCKGLRIIDLTMGWAGPTATRQMADLGADVIKVESCQYPDWFRGTDTRPPYHEERLYEKTHWFQFNNRNKRGITLDLTTGQGPDAAETR